MNAPSPAASKSEWRAWARTLDPVPDALVQQVGRSVAELLRAVDGPVLGYVALPDEVPCPDGATALPRLDDEGRLSLHVADGPRERHRFGVDQPMATAEVVPAPRLAAVLVPGRVFDRAGYRLGRGGGHYDRLLPQLRPGTPVIGITCEARLVDRLPREPHDVAMTHLATELGAFSTK